MTEPTEPRVQFLIGGVQKGGTTAMAQCLALHPQVLLPNGKEAHVFDAANFDDGWQHAEVDRRYAPHFSEAGATPGQRVGDATPIYCLHERFVQRIARYNPQMLWVILLRHPVERAVSQYYMERARGDERWPLLPALLLERWRLRGHHDDFSAGSPLRRYSYRLRGDYARQLDTLYRHFPRAQVLVLRSDVFRLAPADVLIRVYDHLGLPGSVWLPQRTEVFAGEYAPPARDGITWLFATWLLRKERRTLRSQDDIIFD